MTRHSLYVKWANGCEEYLPVPKLGAVVRLVGPNPTEQPTRVPIHRDGITLAVCEIFADEIPAITAEQIEASLCDRCGETVSDIDAGFSPGLQGMMHSCGGTWRTLRANE